MKWLDEIDFVHLPEQEKDVVRRLIVYQDWLSNRALLSPIWVQRIFWRTVVRWFEWQTHLFARVLTRLGTFASYEPSRREWGCSNEVFRRGYEKGQKDLAAKMWNSINKMEAEDG